MTKYILFLLIGHVLGDFYFQTQKISSKKAKYYKWVTGGDFIEEKKFVVTTAFLKEHETSLYNTTSSIKLIIHKLIKFI